MPDSVLPSPFGLADQVQMAGAALAAKRPGETPLQAQTRRLRSRQLAHEVCSRLSAQTGWPIRFVPDGQHRTGESVAGQHVAGENDSGQGGAFEPPALWQSDLREGPHRSGWLRVDQSDRRRDRSFIDACTLAEAVVPTLSAVLAEPCESTELAVGDDGDNSHETLDQTLAQLLENLLHLTGLRSAGFFLRSDNGMSLELRSQVHRDGQVIPQPTRTLCDSPFDARAIGHRRSLVRRQESELPAEFWDVGDCWLPSNCLLGVCEPVMTASEPCEVYGTLWAFDRRSRRLSRREMQIVESVAARLGQVLERAVAHQESADRQRLTDDLIAAAGNTPDEVGHFTIGGGRFEIATRCHAHSSVGGDLCEVLIDGPERSEQVVFGLGDASGHSLPATMVMATVRGALRALALDETIRFESDAIMRRLNNALVGVAQSHQFMTMVTGHLDGESSRLTFTNAGHPLPVILRGQTDSQSQVDTPGSHGMLLGVFEDAEYERQTLNLQPGDIVVLYTDGLAEAQNPERVMFRTDGVAQSAMSRRHESAAAIRDGLWNDVEAHLAGVPCDDDRTVMVLKAH